MPAPSAIKNAELMRSEITTIEQFLDIGTYSKVAKKYEVSKSTAHAHMRHLKAEKAKEEKAMDQEIIQGPSQAEVEQFFTDDKPAELPEVKMDPVQVEVPRCADCGNAVFGESGLCQICNQELADECPELYEVLEESVSELEKNWDDKAIEDKWREVSSYVDCMKKSLSAIRRMKIKRIDAEIEEYLTKLMEETRC